MSKVAVEFSCDDSPFVMYGDGDVYITAEISGNIYYILLDGGNVFCEGELNSFLIKPIPIGSVIKITV
jgi:hypothetical protein